MPTDLIATAQKLLRHDRLSETGARAMVNSLIDLLHFGDFYILEQVSSGRPGERVNLIGTKGPLDVPPLILSAPIGPSPAPTPATWPSLRNDPVRVHDGALISHGSQSGLIDALVKILAASRFPADRLKRPILIALSSGSEGSGAGLQGIMDILPLPPPKAEGPRPLAFCYAPTAGMLWQGHPGLLVLDIRIQRETRHRRMPPHEGFFEIERRRPSAHALLSASLTDPEGAAPTLLESFSEAIEVLREAGEIRILSLDIGDAANRKGGRGLMRFASLHAEAPKLPPGFEIRPLEDGTALPFPMDEIYDAWKLALKAGLGALTDHRDAASLAPELQPLPPPHTGLVRSGRDLFNSTLMLPVGPQADPEALADRFYDAANPIFEAYPELSLSVEIILSRPAYQVDPHTAPPSLQALPWSYSQGSSEAGLLRLFEMESYAYSALGPLEALYRDDEKVAISALEASLAFYEKLITDTCL